MAQALQAAQPRRNLMQVFAERFNIDPEEVAVTLKATAFRQGNNAEVTDAQMTALIIVSQQYGLNPWTKELYAYPDKAGIVPVVSVDGWARIINERPELNGIEFKYAENIVTPNGGKPCPEWIECVITRKDRDRPTVIREYLDECFRELTYANPWKTHTKRMLRHKSLIQCARIAFGFAGIYDQDEAERILEGSAMRVDDEPPQIEGPRTINQPKAEGAKAEPSKAEPPKPARQPATYDAKPTDEKKPVKLGPSALRTLDGVLARCGHVDADGVVDPIGVLKQFNLQSIDEIDTPEMMNQVIEWVSENKRNKPGE